MNLKNLQDELKLIDLSRDVHSVCNELLDITVRFVPAVSIGQCQLLRLNNTNIPKVHFGI